MEKKISIALSLLIFLSFLTFLNPGVFADDNYVIYLTADGAAIEAEDADIDDSFALIEDAEASGGKYIFSQTNNKYVGMNRYDLGEYFKTNKVPLTLTVNSAEAGYYVVYMRVLTAHGKGDYYQRLNGNGYFRFTSNPRNMFDDNEKYTWITMSGYRFSQGINVVEFCYRQDMAIDKIIITKNAVDSPRGLGETTSAFHFKENTEDTSYLYSVPEIIPTQQRPRLLVHSDNISEIRNNLTHPRNAGVYNKLISSSEGECDCIPDTSSVGVDNTNLNYLNYIEGNAFLYLMNGNAQNGYKAINGLLNYLSYYDTEPGSTTASRKVGYMAYIAGLVYDWCNELLTTAQKEEIVNNIIFNFKRTEFGWPPSANAGFSHGEETLLPYMISFGIAVYGDYSEIYNISFGKALKESIPTRNMRYSESNYNQEGEFYSAIRSGSDWFLYLMLHELGCENLITDKIRWQPYTYIFRNSPSGAYLRDGDGEAYPLVKSSGGGIETFLGANLFSDPYLNSEFYRFYKSGNFTIADPAVNMTMFLALNNVNLDMKQRNELPLSYYTGNGTGMMTARTSWNEGLYANTMIASFKTPEKYFGGHGHRDSGHFYIYYKGPLALDSGVYTGQPFYNDNGEYITNIGSGSDHNAAYAKQTIAHNALLIYDPNEDTGDLPNNGGQYPENPISVDPEEFDRNSREYGEVLGADFGPDYNTPEYTYLKGDITNAYNSKAEEYTRSFMFLNFFDDIYPGALIVFDKVISSDEDFKKIWLLHTQEEPLISQNIAIASNTQSGYNGRITNETLLPEMNDLDIKKTGGAGMEYPDINGVNQMAVPINTPADESGKWRVEITPKTAKKADMFLNVLTVSENNDEIEAPDSEYIENADFVGVKIKNKVVFLGKERERYSKNLMVSVSGELNNYDFYISDLKEGLWRVYNNGMQIAAADATSEGGVIKFTAAPGEYNLVRDPDSEIKHADYNFLNNTVNAEWHTTVAYNNVFDSSIKTISLNGKPYLSIKDLVKRIDKSAKITETSQNITAEFYKGTSFHRKVVWTAGQKKAYITSCGTGNTSAQSKTIPEAVISDANGELYTSYDSITNVLFYASSEYDTIADVVRVSASASTVNFDGTINMTGNEYGTVYPEGTTVFRRGRDSIKLYVKPDNGFKLKSIKIDGEEVLSSETASSFTMNLGVLSGDKDINILMEPELSVSILKSFFEGRIDNVKNDFYSIFFGELDGNALPFANQFGIEINGTEYLLENSKNEKVYSDGKYGVGRTRLNKDKYYRTRGFFAISGHKFYGDYVYFGKDNVTAVDILNDYAGAYQNAGFGLFKISK